MPTETRQQRKPRLSTGPEPFWTPADTKYLESINLDTLRLWTRADQLYGLSPPDLIPPDVPVGHIDIVNDEIFPHWSQSFCKILMEIIICPFFYDDISFLHFAIKAVLHFRLDTPYPDKAEIRYPRDEKYIHYAPQIFSRADNRGPGCRKRLIDLLGYDLPRDFDFIDKISLRVSGRPFLSAVNGVITSDLNIIREAWDLHAADYPVRLRSIDDCKKVYRSEIIGQGRPEESTAPELGQSLIKDWVINSREAEEKQRDIRRPYRQRIQIVNHDTDSEDSSLNHGNGRKSGGPSNVSKFLKRKSHPSGSQDESFSSASRPPRISHKHMTAGQSLLPVADNNKELSKRVDTLQSQLTEALQSKHAADLKITEFEKRELEYKDLQKIVGDRAVENRANLDDRCKQLEDEVTRLRSRRDDFDKLEDYEETIKQLTKIITRREESSNSVTTQPQITKIPAQPQITTTPTVDPDDPYGASPPRTSRPLIARIPALSSPAPPAATLDPQGTYADPFTISSSESSPDRSGV